MSLLEDVGLCLAMENACPAQDVWTVQEVTKLEANTLGCDSCTKDTKKESSTGMLRTMDGCSPPLPKKEQANLLRIQALTGWQNTRGKSDQARERGPGVLA